MARARARTRTSTRTRTRTQGQGQDQDQDQDQHQDQHQDHNWDQDQDRDQDQDPDQHQDQAQDQSGQADRSCQAVKSDRWSSEASRILLELIWRSFWHLWGLQEGLLAPSGPQDPPWIPPGSFRRASRS